MSISVADRVKETSTTTGTGTYALDGAVAGFDTFAVGIGDGNQCYYTVTDDADWEVGIGTVADPTSGATLTRDIILASSTGGAAISWTVGTRDVFVTIPATSATVSHLGSFDANQAIFPNSNPAAAESRNEHLVLAFDDTVAENIIFRRVLERGYAEGNLTVDIDWVAASATTGGVTWGVEFERSAPGGQDIDADSFAAQQTGTSTTNGTSGVKTRTSIVLTQAQADSIAKGDAYRLRVQRVVGDVGDDMVGDAQIADVTVRQ